jgi:hypothetical protein
LDPKGGGGGRFLPLPILAALLFVVLAFLGAQQRAASPSGPDSTPDVAGLWAKARSGQLEPETGHVARDTIFNVTVEGTGYLKDLVVRFNSIPGRDFRMEGFGSILDVDEIRGWGAVYAYFYYTADEGLLLVWLNEA